MINFFRKIRQSLLTENKFSKYMLYAIGEIILVVIGILIALQINTWNQNRISANEEQAILNNIHIEFLQNKETLKQVFLSTDVAITSGKTLFNLIGKNREEIEKHNIDSLFFNSLEPSGFRPSENTISDLLQSGKLQLLKNVKLKDLIFQWSRSMKAYNSSHNRLEIKTDEEYVQYLTKNYSMKNIDRYSRLKWKNKTLLKIDKFQVFEDIEFENILDDYLYRISTCLMRINELEILIDDIIKETEVNND